MHIPHFETLGDFEPKRSGRWMNKVWHWVRFSVVTGLIFFISFAALNFGAYKEILISVFNSKAYAQVRDGLTLLTNDPAVDPSQLLEVLPDHNEVKKTFAWLDSIPVVPTDNRLVIPKLGKSVPLVNLGTEHIEGESWHELEKQIQGGLQQGVVHYPGTASPGQFGNVFLTGHSSYYPWDPGKFKDVFATLGQLDIGDRYYVYYNQIKYTYEVREKLEVTPDKVEVLHQPTDQKMSTLMTCTPVGTTLRRLIIHAEQIS
ncbi:sortase [Candidatus Peregrinibacteria bacterium]|nr:MAG: sortase [Candidatus Peregrinibacteria bacterium]